MDPALEVILRERPSRRSVPVLARLHQPGRAPHGLRVVSDFGHIVTGRVDSQDIRRVRRAREVASLKGARPVRASRGEPLSTSRDVVATPTALADRAGAGCVVAVIDFGCDLTSPALRDADGNSRLAALWDQRAVERSNSRHGYGAVFDRDRIAAAMRDDDPHGALGYARDGEDDHGADVLEICARMLPACELVFVHLHADDTHDIASLGDSVRVAEALDFVREVAAGQPWVANLSIGSNGGPRDGTTLLERAIDALHADDPNACVVCSGGNYGGAAMHAYAQTARGDRTVIVFELDEAHGDVEVELWYRGIDELHVTLAHPDTEPPTTAALGQIAIVRDHRRDDVGSLHHRRSDPNNGDHHVDLFLRAAAPPGRWQLAITGERVRDGSFHAWIERCDDRCARFVAPHDLDAVTLGTLGACRSAVVVGATGDDVSRAPAAFASTGPSRDGRAKPDLVAPGTIVLGRDAARRTVTGTSFATPQVSAAIAALLARGLDRERAVAALRTTGAPTIGNTAMQVRPQAAMQITTKEKTMKAQSTVAIHRNTWSQLVRSGRSEEFERVAGPDEAPACRPTASTWVVERGPGPINLASAYRVGDAAVLDARGRVPAGRMLVRPRLQLAEKRPQIRADSIRYLAFEGGGGKGLIYTGALRALEQKGVLRYGDRGFAADSRLQGIAGASAGAITALLVALGMTPADIEAEMARTEFAKFYDPANPGHWQRCRTGPTPIANEPSWLDHIASGAAGALKSITGLDAGSIAKWVGSLFGDASPPWSQLLRNADDYFESLKSDFGLFDGWFARQTLARIVGRELAKHDPERRSADQLRDATFRDLERVTGIQLAVSGSNLTTGRSELFSPHTTPSFPLADAVRISMGFPLAFKPVVIVDPIAERLAKPGEKLPVEAWRGFWVDGGLLDNIPAHAFGASSNELLALQLGRERPRDIDGVGDYLIALASTLIGAGEARVSASRIGYERYLTLDTGDLGTLDFTPPKETVRKLSQRAFATVAAAIT